jgi:3-methylfumaryl-CoA hydratase
MAIPDLADLGLRSEAETILDDSQARRVARTLDLDDETVLADGTLPLTWMWAWFTPTAATEDLRVDGHPAGRPDGALTGLDRRMLVGGRLERSGRVRLDVPTRRLSEVRSAEEKHGSSGPFVVIEVEHRYEQADTTVLTERQQILYRTAPTTPVPAVGDPVEPPAGSFVVVPDERLLFRFSALTFNTHRIHYDLPYATDVEGYPGLVVHGPLTATILAGLAERQLGRPLTSFSFRATAPTFAGVPVAFHIDPGDEPGLTLRAVRSDGLAVMTAQAS